MFPYSILDGDGEPAAPKLSRGKGTSQAKADVVKAAAATKEP
jgi:hypothetical protein